ncbi:MAG: hypothetical protein ACOYKQ_13450, partial [Polymorphobacter sp.]
STPNLVVAGIRLGVESIAQGCTARFRAIADVRHERPGAAGVSGTDEARPSPATVLGSDAIDVALWAKQADVGRAALQQAIVQAARANVDAYPWPTPIFSESLRIVASQRRRHSAFAQPLCEVVALQMGNICAASDDSAVEIEN